MRQGSAPYDLRSLLGKSLRSLALDKRVRAETCLLHWDEVVGEQVAGAAQPDFVRDGKIFVTVKSAVWANELTFYKSDIISRLNERAGSPVIKDLVFKTGSPKPKHVHHGAEKGEPLDLAGIALDETELAKVEEAVDAAGEAGGESFRRLLETAMRLEKWKAANGWTPCRKCGALQNGNAGVCPDCENQS